jgi:hypothetical protein
MTAAGQSALNIQGLDTVVIEDAQFTTLVRRGKGVLTRLPLGANEILQMAGRVHGRVAGGEVWILSERDIDFASLQPTEPNFQLAGDPERVAMTCADMGVRADDLDLPVELDRVAYGRAVQMLEQRGLISRNRLTEYGRKVEVLPVDRPWGELLVQADEDLIPIVAVCASIESLHRMTRADRFGSTVHRPGKRPSHRLRPVPGCAGEMRLDGERLRTPAARVRPGGAGGVGGGARRAGPLRRGRGARARLHLPIARPRAPPNSSPRAQAAGGRWQRLLARVMPSTW